MPNSTKDSQKRNMSIPAEDGFFGAKILDIAFDGSIPIKTKGRSNTHTHIYWNDIHSIL
jgi:hypothetical protein